jgi:hypothetical protein
LGVWQEVRFWWSRVQQADKLEVRAREWFGSAAVIAGYNTHDSGTLVKQRGGTAVVVRGDLSHHHINKKGVDPSGL